MSHWFDIGVNLPDQRLDTEEVVAFAFEQDVKGMLLTGTSEHRSHEAASLAANYPGQLFSTAGVHPHNAKDVSENFVKVLGELASLPSVKAIGECGLDFNRDFSPRQDQIRVFTQQLELAIELNMPVFLHERDGFETQYKILQQYRGDLVGGVVHCFTGTLEQMQAYLELDLYIGITGWICDPKRGVALQHAAAHLPLDRVLLETDSPYLMPKSMQSKSRNNQPANLPHIATQLASIMGVSVQDLKQHCWHNSNQLFALGQAEMQKEFTGAGD